MPNSLPRALRCASSPRAGRAAWCAPPATGCAPGTPPVLDDTAFAGLEYTLPANWKQLWMTPLPASAAKPDAEKIQRQPQSDHRCGPCFPVANYRPRWLWRRATAGEKRQLGSMERQRDAERRGGDFQPDRRAPPITQTERHSLDGQYH